MADDLVLISWNVERKSSGAFKSQTDTPEQIATAIADEVQANGTRGADTPFVSYLLEIKGSDPEVAKMCTDLADAYRAYTGRTVRADRIDLSGGSRTQEWVIALSQGVEVKHRILDIQSEVEPAIQADKDNARDRLAAQTARHAPRRREVKPRSGAPDPYVRQFHPYEPQEGHFRRNSNEKDWFRNGVVSDISVGDKTIRAGTVHSPGPDYVKKFPESVDAALQAALKSGLDVLLGDFNRDGEFSGPYFDDLIRPKGIGTTLSRNAANAGAPRLGARMRDRVFNFDWNSNWEVTARDPLLKGRSPLEPQLTDHAMIVVGATPRRPMPEISWNAPPMGEDDYYATLGMNPFHQPEFESFDPFGTQGGPGATPFAYEPPPPSPFISAPFTSPFPSSEPMPSPFEPPPPSSNAPFGMPDFAP